ncbi:MAG: ABC transporter permease [Colwellia sp.]|nr:ABC transporter permease [Colwellia sp.]
MELLGKLGHVVTKHFTMFADLLGLFTKSLRTSRVLLSKNRFSLFWQLFIRQLYNTGIKAIYVNTIIAILVGILMMSLAYSLLGDTEHFINYYAKLFVIVIIREIGPLISGVILVARSASAVTAEIGYLRQHQQLEVLQSLRINPVFLLMLPVFYAFPLSLLLMFFYFDLVCMLSSWLFISLLQNQVVSLDSFIRSIIEQISFTEALISISKALLAGVFIGLACIYYGMSVEKKFASISQSISSSTTSQLIILFTINIVFSMVAYR